MKKITLLFSLFIIIACSKNNNGLLSLEQKNGAGVKKDVKFEINDSTIKEIESLNLNGGKDVNQLIEIGLAYANGYISVQLNNPSSYDFIDDSIGDIYVSGDTLNISYNFTAQNGFGNKIISKAYLELYNENGELKTDIEIQ